MNIDQVTMRRRKLGLTGIDSQLTAGGYTLYTGQTAGGRVDLVDINGQKVHEWQMPVRPGRPDDDEKYREFCFCDLLCCDRLVRVQQTRLKCKKIRPKCKKIRPEAH